MSSTSLNRTIAEERGTYLMTRDGVHLRLRPVTPRDSALLAGFLARLSPEDLRFRFLDSRKLPSAEGLAALLDVDHLRSEHVLAFDTHTGQLIASLMVVADRRMEAAEVAIAVASEWKGRGIGWTLLRHACDLALIRGLKKLRCLESRANHEAIEVERALGFHAHELSGEPDMLLLEADLA